MPVKSAKKKTVFIPSKPWSALERSKSMSAGGKVGVPARFFELVYVERGHATSLGKKNMIGVSAKTLSRLISNPEIAKSLRNFLLQISKEKKIELSERTVLSQINSITKTLNRRRFSPDEFTFLEDLRISLINYLREKFGK